MNWFKFENLNDLSVMSDILKYLIVDDDEIARLAIESEAGKFTFFRKIASCAHPLQAAELISQHNPDIIFVDIEMPDMNGLELVKMFPDKSMVPVFITSHPEFAVDGYSVQAFDYLLKPLNAERFSRCALRLRDFFQLRNKAYAFDREQEANFIIIKQGYEKHRLRLQDILYLEAMKDYTRIILSGKQYLVLAPLSVMLEKLSSDQFVRIHRSYVVNVNKVTEIKQNKIVLQTIELPLGKLYKNSMKIKFRT
jgi:DNA-binding LytR/AlgR family response regulator